MNTYLVRALVALLLMILLWARARNIHAAPHRRRAFGFAALAFALFGLSNGIVAAGIDIGAFQIAIVGAGLSLFVGAVVSLTLALRGGELREQSERIAKAAHEYRDKRTR